MDRNIDVSDENSHTRLADYVYFTPAKSVRNTLLVLGQLTQFMILQNKETF